MERGDWPEPPDLSAGEVHVWWGEALPESASDSGPASWLDAAERSRASRFRQELHRRRFVARQALLRGILAGYVRCSPGALAFGAGAHGKPYLEGAGEALAFNLSHSEGHVLVAVARSRTVGIDVEAVADREELAGMARLTFAPQEHRVWESLPDEDRLEGFFRVWTRKEAALKALGDGFSREPRTLSVGLGARAPEEIWCPTGEPVLAEHGLADLPAPPGFAAALCAYGIDWRPRTVASREAPLRA